MPLARGVEHALAQGGAAARVGRRPTAARAKRQGQQAAELVGQQRRRQRRPQGHLGRQRLREAAERRAPAAVAVDAARHVVAGIGQPRLDPRGRQLDRHRVGRLLQVKGIAAPRIDQHRVAGQQARRALFLHRDPGRVGLAQQVVEVVAAVGDGAARAVHVLRAAAHPVHVQRPERRGFERGAEAAGQRAGHVHLEKTFADRADPVVQPLRRRHGVGRPGVDRSRGCGHGGGSHPANIASPDPFAKRV
ncbi:hypothetical protein FQZ97_692360 [compost metagenome]